MSEVAEALDVPQHVLRFWETKFTQVKPLKRAGGRRYYRPDDVVLLQGIRHLLYGEGYTLRGVQRILREKGVRGVKEIGGQVQGEAQEPPKAAAPEPVVEAPPEEEAPAPADAAPEASALSTAALREPGLSPAAKARLEDALRALDRADAVLTARIGETEDED
ncbi:MAG: MerR family transcriptional regulator [Pseudomonadota bacterium]